MYFYLTGIYFTYVNVPIFIYIILIILVIYNINKKMNKQKIYYHYIYVLFYIKKIGIWNNNFKSFKIIDSKHDAYPPTIN
jgi:ABC-type proline/glycine betaine transport system permease subunit